MTFNFSAHKDSLFFVPLGGSNEIGMNLNAYHLDGKWLLIDMGIGFTDEYFPGVDIMVPDIDFLVERKNDILGLVITHAHEDHLGAVPYLWDELQCPIYATKFTASVLRHKLQSNSNFGKIPVKIVEEGSEFQIGPFSLDLIPLTHSIPEMQAVAINTSHGTIMHTGDWKLDDTPLVGPATDEIALKNYGDKGVLAMVCDSTNVFVEGESGSESAVRDALVEHVKAQKGRVFVATFASNIARVESIIHAAKESGRSVVLAGRSLWRITAAAKDAGYLQDAPEFISDRDMAKLPKDEVLILCTGCQGEPRAALTRIVDGSHPSIRISKDDSVYFSSRVIPGNETRVRYITNELVRLGVNIITDKEAFVHVSGHPARGELKRMYDLVRPAVAVPVHGEAAHIAEHSRYAKKLGIPHAVEPYNGAVIEFKDGKASIVGNVPTGYFAMDGTSLIALNSPVIAIRRRLQESGSLTASIVMDKDGEMLTKPLITAPGSLDFHDDAELRELLCDDIEKLCASMNSKVKIQVMKEKLVTALRKRILNELGKKPMVDVHIHQI
jgi:ribonuclease J